MKLKKDWESHAETNPYWAVVTWDKFKGNIEDNPEILGEFFHTGRQYIDVIHEIIAQAVCPDFNPTNVLDFGCGVGRLLVPLAERGLTVSGVDISETMLSLAGKHLSAGSFSPVDLAQSVDELPDGARYDLVHTFITLQHIPVKLGLSIIGKLLERVSEDGIAVFHVTYFATRDNIMRRIYARMINSLKYLVLRVDVLHSLFRAVRGRDMTPVILMGNYPLNTVFAMLNEAKFNNIHIRHTQHGPPKGVVVFAQRSQSIPHPLPL